MIFSLMNNTIVMQGVGLNVVPAYIALIPTSDMAPIDGNIVIQGESCEQQNNPIIQQDMDLWQWIKEYDKKLAEAPFTPVLSKKKKHNLKLQ